MVEMGKAGWDFFTLLLFSMERFRDSVLSASLVVGLRGGELSSTVSSKAKGLGVLA